jgi:hypothetical protein
MSLCVQCGTRVAEWTINAEPHCAAAPCLIGALQLSPGATLPHFERDANGLVRPCASALAPLALSNIPSAADTADMLLTLADMDARARLDVLTTMRTTALRLLGERQHSVKAFAAFSADCLRESRETRVPVVRFLPSKRDVDPAFLALVLATLYVAWIGEQRRLVHAQVQTIAFLVRSTGSANAAATEREFYAPL